MGILSKESIELIDHLIQTCKDGQEGFRSAAADAKDAELKQLFSGYSSQRADFAAELRQTAKALGEDEPTNQSSMVGDLHRAWINLRSAMAVREDEAILEECDRGEDHALKTYREAAGNPDIPSELRTVVSRQLAAIEAAHESIRARRAGTP